MQLAEALRRLGGASVVGLEHVAVDNVSRYGIVGGQVQPGGTVRLRTRVEKPSPADAPSDPAIAARHVLAAAVARCS